jgi:sec-independent protein translocase protein TatA
MGLDNPLHIAFLVILLLLVFGAKRLPEMGRSLGSGMREFKASLTTKNPQPSSSEPKPEPALPAIQAQSQTVAVMPVGDHRAPDA